MVKDVGVMLSAVKGGDFWKRVLSTGFDRKLVIKTGFCSKSRLSESRFRNRIFWTLTLFLFSLFLFKYIILNLLLYMGCDFFGTCLVNCFNIVVSSTGKIYLSTECNYFVLKYTGVQNAKYNFLQIRSIQVQSCRVLEYKVQITCIQVQGNCTVQRTCNQNT